MPGALSSKGRPALHQANAVALSRIASQTSWRRSSEWIRVASSGEGFPSRERRRQEDLWSISLWR